jgi:hypothetical protein
MSIQSPEPKHSLSTTFSSSKAPKYGHHHIKRNHCVSIIQEILYIDHQRLIGGSSFGLLYNWMDCKEAVHPNCLGTIKCLEIRNMLWYSPKAGRNLAQTLIRFRGLRELDITIDKMGLPTNFDRLNQSVKTILEEWFKRHKNRFLDGKTPAFTVRHL